MIELTIVSITCLIFGFCAGLIAGIVVTYVDNREYFDKKMEKEKWEQT